MLRISAVKLYITAIINLQSFQKSKGINLHLTLCSKALNSLLQACLRSKHKQQRLNFTDRAMGTLQDSYNKVKIIKVIYFYQQGQRKQLVELYLYTAINFLLTYNLLLQSKSYLTTKFPNFFIVLLLDKGLILYFLIVIIIDNRKTNLLGQLKYVAIIRYQNLLLYTISYIAFYLFYQQDIIGKPLPYFYQYQLQYNLYLIKGEHIVKKILYNMQLKQINRIFTRVNIILLKKTHIG